MSSHCVIVGAGHAAAQLCLSLVQGGWKGRLTLVGEELYPPYHRPPLSKTQLDPAKELDPALIRPRAFYENQGIELRLGERVLTVDRTQKRICTDKGEIDYDHLVLCTGSQVRMPPIEGVSLPGVYGLRNLADAESLRHCTGQSRRVVMIGAGFIGLEVAASLRNLGLDVTVLEREKRVLSRVTCPEISRYVEALHRDKGVKLELGISVEELSPSAEGLTLHMGEDRVMSTEAVVIGAGATPETGLAEAAGLEVENGIRVNAFNQTSDPDIYAMGDCCTQWFSPMEKTLRIESVQNANDQAKTVAAAILGTPRPHEALPWFWSDQFEVKLQIVGISAPGDEVVLRGKGEAGTSFSAWYFRKGLLRAVDAVNDARAYAVATKCLKSGINPDPGVISDTSIDLKTLITQIKES